MTFGVGRSLTKEAVQPSASSPDRKPFGVRLVEKMANGEKRSISLDLMRFTRNSSIHRPSPLPVTKPSRSAGFWVKSSY